MEKERKRQGEIERERWKAKELVRGGEKERYR